MKKKAQKSNQQTHPLLQHHHNNKVLASVLTLTASVALVAVYATASYTEKAVSQIETAGSVSYLSPRKTVLGASTENKVVTAKDTSCSQLEKMLCDKGGNILCKDVRVVCADTK